MEGQAPREVKRNLRPSSHCCSKLRKPLQSHRAENEDEQDTGNIDFSNHGFDYKVRFGWAPEVHRRPIHDDSDPSDDTSNVTSWDEFNENADSFKWLEPIEARAYERTSTGRENITTWEAIFISRDEVRIRFQETMDELGTLLNSRRTSSIVTDG
jgi:8-oxo-dGTP pyrophosphatase MutT (NUDIX family)